MLKVGRIGKTYTYENRYSATPWAYKSIGGHQVDQEDNGRGF
jgi:hypothetical protein